MSEWSLGHLSCAWCWPLLLLSLASIPACSVTLSKCHVLSGPLWASHRQRRLDVVVPPLPVPFTTCARVGERVNRIVLKLRWQGSQRALWARGFGLGHSHACVGDSPVLLVVLLWQALQPL